MPNSQLQARLSNSHNIPAVSVVARVRPATLKQRTQQGREKNLSEMLTSLKNTIEICSSVEERLDSNEITYIPIISSSKPAESRYISKFDIYIPCLFLILSVVFLLLGFVGVPFELIVICRIS